MSDSIEVNEHGVNLNPTPLINIESRASSQSQTPKKSRPGSLFIAKSSNLNHQEIMDNLNASSSTNASETSKLCNLEILNF